MIEQRALVRQLLDSDSPADAPTAYYALHHDLQKSHLISLPGPDGRTRAFAGWFRTGLDLFRPLVTLAAATPEDAASVLAQALTTARPYIIFARKADYAFTGGSFEIQSERTLDILTLDRSRFQPVVNVLVRRSRSPERTPRAEIRSRDTIMASAGVNWQSTRFAEIYVQTEPEARQRGWGKSVAAAVIDDLLESGRHPLYLVESTNEASMALADSLGFRPVGAQQVYAEAVYTGHPAKETPE